MQIGALAALKKEWQDVGTSRAACRALAGSAEREPRLAGFASPAELVEWLHRVPYQDGAPVLDALVHLSADDELARRIAVQAMIPLMTVQVGWVRRWVWRSGAGWTPGEVEQCVVAATVGVLADLSGRRVRWAGRRIASKLRKRLHALVAREYERASNEEPVGLGLEARRVDWSAAAPPYEVRGLLRGAVASGRVSERDAELVWLTRVVGYEPIDLVDRFGATRDTLLKRRHRAEQALAAQARRRRAMDEAA